MYRFSLTQRIVFAGLFVALGVVFKSLQINLYVVSIRFSYIPFFLSGIILGPIYGFAVGAVADLTGALFAGYTIAPLITLSNGLLGFIMGAVFMIRPLKNPYIKIITGAVLVTLLITWGLNSYALTVPPAQNYANISIALSVRIPGQTPMVAINTALTIICYSVLEQYVLKKYTVNTDDNNG